MSQLGNIPFNLRAAVVTLAAGAVLGAGCSKPANTPEPASGKQGITTSTVAPSTSNPDVSAQVGASGLLSIEQSPDGTFKGICEDGKGGTRPVFAPSAQQLDEQCLGR